MKKIIIWISAITRHLFTVTYPVNSPANKATKLFKGEPPLTISRPQTACKSLSCQQNCIRKATHACSNGKVKIEFINAFPEGTLD